ncbi:hypothetical protein GMOD_00009954 [Pyrenophora seminiperda CCB06]|uniref:Uncharacterized protein n=1 Tax=Pyrenophora seminiperda CCB06 TaxID=1302712 RepID=A0A3M7M1S6_9PLEO|nr:hypothetical protein GMOD_00009954 [Pyrenophora seminiperda CCB06]
MISGLFPPSSTVTCFRFDSKAAFLIAFAVFADPMNEILRMSMWEAMATNSVTGAFQGIMAAQTPYGCRKVRLTKFGVCKEDSPLTSAALPAMYLMNLAMLIPSAYNSQSFVHIDDRHNLLYFATGLPIHTASCHARSLLCISTSSANRKRYLARSKPLKDDHGANASFAARTALSTSAASASKTDAVTSSVAGLMTLNLLPLTD